MNRIQPLIAMMALIEVVEATEEPMTALEKALKHVEDTFRTERQEKLSIILTGHRIKKLVEDGRYDYHDAVKALGVNVGEVYAAHYWLIDDNARLNALYECEIHRQLPSDWIMVGWMKDEEEKKITKFSATA